MRMHMQRYHICRRGNVQYTDFTKYAMRDTERWENVIGIGCGGLGFGCDVDGCGMEMDV